MAEKAANLIRYSLPMVSNGAAIWSVTIPAQVRRFRIASIFFSYTVATSGETGSILITRGGVQNIWYQEREMLNAAYFCASENLPYALAPVGFTVPVINIPLPLMQYDDKDLITITLYDGDPVNAPSPLSAVLELFDDE